MSSSSPLASLIDAVHVSDLDCEHAVLHQAVRDISDEISRAESHSDVLALGNELLALLEAHFHLEERLMDALHFAQAGPHREAHKQLSQNLRDTFAQRTGTDDVAAFGAALAERVLGWLSDHDSAFDAPLIAELAQEPV